jgi:hypothetical protein
MTEQSTYNIRYIGFANLAGAGRRMEYVITGQGLPTRQATVEIPGAAFTGTRRVTFQESAAIGYERLRRAVSDPGPGEHPSFAFVLSLEEIEEYRPRRRAASKKV